jgi:hypothetical protein
MIRVNLLPQEYRKAEATPLKQFFATIGAAVIVTVAAIGWAWVHFGMLDSALQELDTIQNEIKSQEPQVKLSKDLAVWVAEYKGQYDKIDQVAKYRLAWARKVDELWDLVASPPPNSYDVWLKGLTCSTQPGGTKTGGQVQFGGTSAGPKVERMSNYNEALKSNEFFRDFNFITFPSGTREELSGKNREPTEGWVFNWTLQLKPLKDLYEDRAKAARAAVPK